MYILDAMSTIVEQGLMMVPSTYADATEFPNFLFIFVISSEK